jgi:subtilisin family serine protease
MNMKKLIIFCLMCIGLVNTYAQGYFRYVDGEKHYFEISSNEVIVKIGEKVTENAIESSFRNSTSLHVSDISAISNNEFQLVRFYNNNRSAMMQLANQLKSNDTILFVGHVIIDETGKRSAALTNKISIRLKENKDFPVLQKAVICYDIDEIEQRQFDSRSYLLTVNYFSEKSALQIANELHETGLFEYASPSLILFIRYATNDTHFSHQWGLRNTGQNGGTSGIDIKAQQAWSITTGSPNIRIAILDSGVDLSHTDLSPNLLGGFDATGGNNGGNHSVDPHGTAVAGVAAARGNNGRGIAGVAYNCRILPIHMGAAPWAFRVADGVDWAIANGARVINMSFNTANDPDVNRALNDATAAEIVLVACSHNQGVAAVTFPASRPDVIAVGAIVKNGTRWPNSNYGTNLDVVAPGGIDIYTTGTLGATGYGTVINNGANGVYFTSFGGTSAAAPHVAGIAALILSVRPDLTQAQVRQAIESTCRKLSGYTFSNTSGRSNGTWNNQVGHGLVDAYAAVYSVKTRISGPTSMFVGQSATFSVQNAPSIYTWDRNQQHFSGSNGNYTAIASGSSWVSIKLSNGEEVARHNVTITTETIIGPSSICNTGTYSLSSGKSATWSVTPASPWHVNPGFILTGSDQYSATIVAAPSSQGYSGTITAVVGGASVTKTIQACGLAIAGPDPISCGDLVTYSIPGLSSQISGNQITWSSSTSALLPQGGNHGLTKQFLAKGNGSVWIKAEIPSHNMHFEKYVFINADSNFPDLVEYPDKFAGCGVPVSLQPTSTPGIVDYYWRLATPDEGSISNEYGLSAVATFYTNGWHAVLVHDINECGQSFMPNHLFWIYVTGCMDRSAGTSVFPNPANDILTVEIDEAAAEQARSLQSGTKTVRVTPDYDIRLYNILGDLVQSVQTKDSRVEFNVATLPNGIYYLHIYDGISDAPEVQKVIVRR